MLGVGDRFPDFSLKAVAGGAFESLNIDNVFFQATNDMHKGQWLVIFFYPKDFTFVCPTEIKAFGDMNGDFQARHAVLATASTDTEFTHWAWRRHQPDLRDLPIPMLADVKRELSTSLGILDAQEGVSQRAVFVVDPERVIRFAMATDLSVGRNPNEVLRVLDALKTGDLCPCNWQKGQQVIDLKKATS